MFNDLIEQQLVKIRAGSNRPNADRAGNLRVYSIDNRRAPTFKSYLHKPSEIKSADELWSMLQDAVSKAKISVERIADAKKVLEDAKTFIESGKTSNTKPLFLSESFRVASTANPIKRPAAHERSYNPIHEEYNPLVGPMFTPGWHTPSLSMEGPMQSLVEKNQAQMMDMLFDLLDERMKQVLEDKSNIKYEKLERPPETEDAFHERSRYQLVLNKEMPEGWEELQESLEPSLIDEDCLGGFGEWLSGGCDQQFILMGDTNHFDKDLRGWIFKGEYLESLKSAGVTDLVIEYSLDAQPILSRLYKGEFKSMKSLSAALKNELNENVDVSRIATLAMRAKRHGMRLHALDQDLTSFLEPGEEKSPKFAFNRLQKDKPLSKAIKDAVGNRKTAILYGAGHFRYETSLIEQLGQNNCRVIDLYNDLEKYRQHGVLMNAKYVSPYALITGENMVIMTRGKYMRNIPANADQTLASVKMGLQQEEIIKFKDRIISTYGSENSDELYGVSVNSVLNQAYWHKRAIDCGFVSLDSNTASSKASSPPVWNRVNEIINRYYSNKKLSP